MNMNFGDIGFKFPVMPGSHDATMDLAEYWSYVTDKLDIYGMCDKPDNEWSELDNRAFSNWRIRLSILEHLKSIPLMEWTGRDFRYFRIMASAIDLYSSKETYSLLLDVFSDNINTGYQFPTIPDAATPADYLRILRSEKYERNPDGAHHPRAHDSTLSDHKYCCNRTFREFFAELLCDIPMNKWTEDHHQLFRIISSTVDLFADEVTNSTRWSLIVRRIIRSSRIDSSAGL